MKEAKNIEEILSVEDRINNLEEEVNKVYELDKEDCNIVSFRRGGFNNFAGLLWADTEDLIEDALINYNQIVGHNRVKPYSVIKRENYNIFLSDHFDTNQNILLEIDI